MQRGSQENFEGGNEFTFVERLHCLPSIEILEISNYYMKVIFKFKIICHIKKLCCLIVFGIRFKFFAAGGMPQMLPTSLVDLT